MTAEFENNEGAGSLQNLSKFARQIAKGTLIFDQDDEGETMYFVLDGRVRISKIVGNRVQPIAVIESGDFFGEMALLSRDTRTARAEAITAVTLVELDQNTFRDFLKSNNDASIRMLMTLVKRLRSTDELIENLMFDDPQRNVAGKLLEFTEGIDRDVNGFAVGRDVHELMISSGTDERLLRMIMKRFRDAGFLEVYEGDIFVRDRIRLQQYHNFLTMKGDYLSPQ